MIKKKFFIKATNKTTVGVFTLDNGYEFVTYSSCVHEKDYDRIKGEENCLKKAEQKVLELEAYARMENERDKNEVSKKTCKDCMYYIPALYRCSNKHTTHYDSVVDSNRDACTLFEDAFPF